MEKINFRAHLITTTEFLFGKCHKTYSKQNHEFEMFVRQARIVKLCEKQLELKNDKKRL